MIWLVLLACSPEPAAPTPTPPPAPTAAPTEAPPAPGAPHGGDVKTVGSITLEAKFLPEGLLIWVTDSAGTALDTSAFAGATAVVQGEGAPQAVTFTPMGEHLHANAALKHGAPASATVTLTVDGAPHTVQFSTDSVGMAVHEHTAIEGGTVVMWGNLHVEFAPEHDEYRFFVSDAKRERITTGVSGSVKDGETTIPLQFDPATGMLHGEAVGAGTRPVTLEAKVNDQTLSLAFGPAAQGGHHQEEGKEGEGHERHEH